MTRAAACAASVARTSGLLARRTGRRHAARGLPEVRRRGRLRAVGGTGQPVHQGFRGGVRVADDGREPEDGQRFPSCVVEDRRHPSPVGSRNASRRRCRRRSTACTRSAWTRPAIARATRTSPWSSTTSGTGSSGRTTGVGGDVFDLFFKALTPEQHASIRSSPATGPAGSTRASAGGARTPNAYWTASTSSAG